jgi:putative two-component system response regulator
MTPTSTILIVDDDPGARHVLEGILRPFDYTLQFAGTGVEALAQAAAIAPDLILLDVMMPGMDGFAVCRQVRADPCLAEIPVIISLRSRIDAACRAADRAVLLHRPDGNGRL